MKLKNSLDFIYSSCANRINNKINESGLTLEEIYSSDPKILSSIRQNRRTSRNAFLVPDRVFYNPQNDDGLLVKLDFHNSIQEVLWGTTEEIQKSLPQIFKRIVEDLLENELPSIFPINSNQKKDLLRHEPKSAFLAYGILKEYLLKHELEPVFLVNNMQKEYLLKNQSEPIVYIKDILCDYVPFAKYSTYWDILFFGDYNVPAIYYGIREDDVIENIDKSKDDAIKVLYSKCEKDFSKAFIKFTQETESFKKIEKVFENNFIRKSFIPLLKKHIPDENSLGIRVRNLILADLSHVPKLIFSDEPDKEYYHELINASSEYILKLEKIQSQQYDI